MARGSITVRDIARLISLPVQDQRILVEQLRYWTDEGLLVASRGSGKGTGNYRRYGEEMIWRAKLLHTLAYRGAKVEEMGKVINRLDNLDSEQRKLWQMAKETEDCEVYLVIPPMGKPDIFKGLKPLHGWFKLWPALLIVHLGSALKLPPEWSMRGGFHYVSPA